MKEAASTDSIPGFHFQKSTLNRAFLNVNVGACSCLTPEPGVEVPGGQLFVNNRAYGHIFRLILHGVIAESVPLGRRPGTITLIVESFQDGVDASSPDGKFYFAIQLHQEIALALAIAILRNANTEWWLWTPPDSGACDPK